MTMPRRRCLSVRNVLQGHRIHPRIHQMGRFECRDQCSRCRKPEATTPHVFGTHRSALTGYLAIQTRRLGGHTLSQYTFLSLASERTLAHVLLLHVPRADPTVCSDLGELRETALQPWCTQASRLSPAGTACLPTPIASSLGAERAQFLVQSEILAQFSRRKKTQ